MSSAITKPLNFIISLFISLFILNFITVSSLLIAAGMSWVLSVISSVLLGLLTIVFSIFLKKWSLSWTALIAVVTSLLCGMYISDYADLQGREIITNISIAEVSKYPEAAGYTFIDGFVNTELKTTYQKTRTSTSGPTTISFYYAAPVIDKNWDPSKPVTLFAARAIADDTENWSTPYRAGIRAPVSSAPELTLAVKKCIREHNLQPVSEPIMIKWVESPEKAIETYKDDLLSTLIIWNIVLVAGLFVFRIIWFFKHRKKIPEKPVNSENVPANDKITGATILRILFSFYTFYILIFSLYFAKYDFSRFVPIFLLVISLIVYIIAVSALQIAHNKDERSPLDLLYLALYPYLVYFLTFFEFDFRSSSLWLFCGFFYFFIITGGFVFGILFSPLIARRNLIHKNEAKRHTDKGEKILKTGKFMIMAFLFLGSLFGVLTILFLQLVQTVQNLELYRIAIFYILLILGIGVIIKFTYHHTVFNINEDRALKKKYFP